VVKVEIVAVQDRQSSREFLEFPYAHYRGDPCWFPRSASARRSSLTLTGILFIGTRRCSGFSPGAAGRPVGRVAAIQDPNFDRFHGEPFGFFGFFESVNDQEVADALLGAAREWLTERGARTILGPVNPSTNYECGLLVEGFDSSPFVMMTYNPPWYAGLLERAGLRKAKDLYAYTANPGTVERSKIERVAEKALRDTQVRIRPIRMKEFPAEVERIWAVYNSAWSRNWGFVPMTREEFFFMADEMKPLVVPEFVLLGEVGERIVGFALSLPDINQALIHAGGRLFPLGLLKILCHQRRIKSLRVIALGVIGEFRSAGNRGRVLCRPGPGGSPAGLPGL